MLSTFTLVEQNGRTTVTVTWLPWNATDEESQAFDAARNGLNQSWTGTFEQLEAYLNQASA
jgi:hypothetical protein